MYKGHASERIHATGWTGESKYFIGNCESVLCAKQCLNIYIVFFFVKLTVLRSISWSGIK